MKPVSRAAIDDAVELTELVNNAYRGESSKKGWTTEAHLLGGQRVDVETMTGYLLNPAIMILKYVNTDHHITGCVYLQVRNQKLYLGMLSVNPNEQANGIGRQLLHEAELLAFQLECTAITMTVISSRKELLDWYIRRGYKPTGEVIPFHNDEKFGIPKEVIQLLVLDKEI
ncbi:acetyltransferase (GNAT) family protein [Mucilaginibacter yixingensis]|uniref:Acetyltransferase (GNAT) family protein n=1 Tax=Mucilaginibacter yixingensis TaxID=1295612 RepID=A0A2T5JA64_9SPHI|nr:GNAT family N-acetyltransferase [Mucilaginibacter yixingensis]PTQ96948.1 acetyltransferase (GNAT) family protein [Mucilaginibacter yixingensis]